MITFYRNTNPAIRFDGRIGPCVPGARTAGGAGSSRWPAAAG